MLESMMATVAPQVMNAFAAQSRRTLQAKVHFPLSVLGDKRGANEPQRSFVFLGTPSVLTRTSKDIVTTETQFLTATAKHNLLTVSNDLLF